MSAAQLASHMQAAWDHGRDPFDDAEVLALLEQQPELLEKAATWRNSVASLPVATTPTTPPAEPAVTPAATSGVASGAATQARRVYPLLIASLAAACLVFALWPDRAPPAGPNTPTSHAEAPRLESRVLHTSLIQRVEHHGSACSIHTLEVATGTPASTRPRKFTSRVVQTTRTFLDR